MAFRRARGSKAVPKQSRTIPIFGSSERGDGRDADRWYTCWNCGWTNDEERESLTNTEGQEGTFVEDYKEPSPGVNSSGDALDGLPVLGGSLTHSAVSMELDSDGNPKSIRHDTKAKRSGGCPLCGTLNWRGDTP